MLQRSQIKIALDEWQRWAIATLARMRPRDLEVTWPKGFALALTGVRRSGKTFLSLHLASKRSDRLLYFNFEDPLFLNDNDATNLDSIVSVYTEFAGHEPGVIIFDEIQNVSGWERWVRKWVDLGRCPLIITGSSAKLLSSEIATSIAGRCVEHVVWPLSYTEFQKFSDLSCKNVDEHLAMLRRYATWGAFPAVVREPHLENKKAILAQYLNDIVLRDIINRHEIRAKRVLDQIVLFAMTNPASLFSYHSLRKAFGMTVDIAQDYVSYLSEAFLVFEVFRFHSNLKIQARDPRKLYVIDCGLRNVHARSVNEDFGKIAENLVYLELRRQGCEVFYYQKNGEVDFLTTQYGKPERAIQVCYSDLAVEATLERELKALKQCMTDLGLTTGTIITLSREESLDTEVGQIKLVPLYRFLTEPLPMR